MHTASTRTNDLGGYRVYGLTPGIYYVAASYDAAEEYWGGIERTDSESNESYVRTFYADTTDPTGATPVPVGAGAEHVWEAIEPVSLTDLKLVEIIVRPREAAPAAARPPVL